MFSIFFPKVPTLGVLCRKTSIYLLVFLLFPIQVTFPSDKSGEILSIASEETDQNLEIRIVCTSPVISTIYQLPSPERIVVDVADANFSQQFLNKVSTSIAKVNTKEITDTKPNISRIEILLTEKFEFVSKKENNDIVININKKTDQLAKNDQPTPSDASSGGNVQAKSALGPTSKDKIGGLITTNKTIENQLPEINPLANKISPKAKEQQMQDAFNFSGYNKERITVEFQKMDLHNVFNFLRQVSGVNIVVDESVKGSLTLVLDDVPWDFALDIILNLKDLEKEERFNTLVIYPKNKSFNWPEQGQSNLSFQADSRIVEKESLVIKQQEKEPAEIGAARQQIALAKEAEKRENLEVAVGHYEKALEKWPNNSQLANKIASMYLVQLRQNAKALYYAKIALDKDPHNTDAALNAAIASANMQDKQKAVAYFTQCTQIKKPSKESLLSYAAFSEEHNEYSGALKILEKYTALYGESLDSMIAIARVYDKMGQSQQATAQYKKIMLSGFSVPPDLDKFIKGRIALK